MEPPQTTQGAATEPPPPWLLTCSAVSDLTCWPDRRDRTLRMARLSCSNTVYWIAGLRHSTT
jgi:hypothetical protein